MKLSFVCLSFWGFGAWFSFANTAVLFTEPVKAILLKTAQPDTIGYDVHSIDEKKSLQRLFKKDCFENAPIYAKTLLQNEAKILVGVREKLIIIELLDRLKSIFLVRHEDFGLSYDEARALERAFCQTTRLLQRSQF